MHVALHCVRKSSVYSTSLSQEITCIKHYIESGNSVCSFALDQEIENVALHWVRKASLYSTALSQKIEYM